MAPQHGLDSIVRDGHFSRTLLQRLYEAYRLGSAPFEGFVRATPLVSLTRWPSADTDSPAFRSATAALIDALQTGAARWEANDRRLMGGYRQAVQRMADDQRTLFLFDLPWRVGLHGLVWLRAHRRGVVMTYNVWLHPYGELGRPAEIAALLEAGRRLLCLPQPSRQMGWPIFVMDRRRYHAKKEVSARGVFPNTYALGEEDLPQPAWLVALGVETVRYVGPPRPLEDLSAYLAAVKESGISVHQHFVGDGRYADEPGT
ncbi:MAG: hypothetical protein IMW91_01095 [Firmicutes bacterium]|nr:hypothetical protein [Bacillota bacterium]